MFGNYFDGAFVKLVLAVLVGSFIWNVLHGWPFAIVAIGAGVYLAYTKWGYIFHKN